jgi:twitching motility protein PilT
LVEFFPAQKQLMVRQILAGVLRGSIGQRLLPKIGGGRVAAVELMFNTARIADLIRDPLKTDKIAVAIAEGNVHQMQTFNDSLVELVLAGLADRETAANAATNRHDFEIAVEHALKESQAAGRGGLRPSDTPGDGEKPTRLRLAST